MPQAERSTVGPSPAGAQRFRWRRLFQFSLSSLLILTTICAALIAWWLYKAQQQRQAVAALEKVGANVEYDTTLRWIGGTKGLPKWPQWLLDRIGVDFFARVQTLDLIKTQVTDADLKNLKGLTALQTLYLHNT